VSLPMTLIGFERLDPRGSVLTGGTIVPFDRQRSN